MFCSMPIRFKGGPVKKNADTISSLFSFVFIFEWLQAQSVVHLDNPHEFLIILLQFKPYQNSHLQSATFKYQKD